jgi:hypothetical protein
MRTPSGRLTSQPQAGLPFCKQSSARRCVKHRLCISWCDFVFKSSAAKSLSALCLQGQTRATSYLETTAFSQAYVRGCTYCSPFVPRAAVPASPGPAWASSACRASTCMGRYCLQGQLLHGAVVPAWAALAWASSDCIGSSCMGGSACIKCSWITYTVCMGRSCIRQQSVHGQLLHGQNCQYGQACGCGTCVYNCAGMLPVWPGPVPSPNETICYVCRCCVRGWPCT